MKDPKVSDYKAPNVQELFHLGSVDADDTMKVWLQNIKFEVEMINPLKLQMCFDWKHKFQPSKSQPSKFLHFSNLPQIYSLISMLVKSACLMYFGNEENVPKNQLDNFIDTTLVSVRQQVSQNIEETYRRFRLDKSSLTEKVVYEELKFE